MAAVRLTVATASVSLAELRATSYLPEAHPPQDSLMSGFECEFATAQVSLYLDSHFGVRPR